MSRAEKIRYLVESCLSESSPAAVARRQVKPEFAKDTVVLQANWGPGGGFMIGFLSVNKPISSWNKYVTSFNSYMNAKKIGKVEALVSSNGKYMEVVSKRDVRILADDKLMDVIDMWITDKTNWLVVGMDGSDAEDNQVLEDE